MGNPKPPLPGAQQARFIWLIHLTVVYSALICISTALTTPNQRQGHKIVCDQMCMPGRSWTEAGSQSFWSLLPRACKKKTKQSNTHTHVYQKTNLKCPLFIPMWKDALVQGIGCSDPEVTSSVAVILRPDLISSLQLSQADDIDMIHTTTGEPTKHQSRKACWLTQVSLQSVFPSFSKHRLNTWQMQTQCAKSWGHRA